MKLDNNTTLKDLLDSGSLAVDFFPFFQRFIYEVANVYAISMDMTYNILSDVWCVEEEEGVFAHAVLDEDTMKDVIDNVSNNQMEDVLPVYLQEEHAVCNAIVCRIHEKPCVVMFLLGFLQEEQEDSQEAAVFPSGIKHANEANFERALFNAHRVVDEVIGNAYKSYNLEKEMRKAKEARQRIAEDYERTAIITDIVQMLESEDDIVSVVAQIFEKVAKHVGLDAAALYRVNENRLTVSMISEWYAKGEYQKIDTEQDQPIGQYPFFTQQNYIISSNTALRPRQKEFMEDKNLTAVVVFPIKTNQEIVMYLVMACINKPCIWKTEDVRFMSDVRKILQSIVSKRIAQNSLSRSLASMEELLEHLECGVIVVEPSTRTLLFSNHMITPQLDEELRTIDLRETFYGDDVSTELYLEGLNRWIYLSRAKISWVDGQEVELYDFYDITKAKLYEQKMKQ